MTPELYQWAQRHGVSYNALADLAALFGMQGSGTMPAAATGRSEAAAQAVIRLEAARKGVYLWRNNVGALTDSRGIPVRYGLANESKAVNEKIKSGDLIGIRPVLIGPEHLGTTIGQFVSREVKAPGWTFTGAGREAAQLTWAQLVTKAGGDAKFATGEGTL